MEEWKIGATTPPQQLVDVPVDCVGSRRFLVEQVNEKQGQGIIAFRQTDHLTESLINPADTTYEILESDNFDLFLNTLRWLLSYRVRFAMFKDDVSRASKRLLINVHHLKFIVIFFRYQGEA